MDDQRTIMSYDLEKFRDREYPMLKGEVYLDHGGTTLYPRSTLERFTEDMISNLYGNPHSWSTSSRLTTKRVEDIRQRALAFFNASTSDFDLIFVQNATAGVKLVAEILSHSDSLPLKPHDGPHNNGLWYGYHIESHTSLFGIRELSRAGHECFEDDEAVEDWINTGCLGQQQTPRSPRSAGLFAYPGQSNMTGRRLPLSWPGRLRSSKNSAHSNMYTLLDAAALASTAELDLGDADEAPDFTAVSFYKIFGFPNLGGLIVRRALGSVLERRRYFGGGTVEAVVATGDRWHSTKVRSPHEHLEDGTLPFHNIVALGYSLTVHQQLFGSQQLVSEYTSKLSRNLFERLSALQHANGRPICVIYKHPLAQYGDSDTQGPTIAFNLRDMNGRWIRLSELEKAATRHRIHLRTGDVCNPGGVAKALELESWELFRNYAAGLRCGCKNAIIGGKPSGIARVGLGAMSNMNDVKSLIDLVETFRNVDTIQCGAGALGEPRSINSIILYPIEGCCGWRLGENAVWEVGPSGLRWDRGWCIINIEEGVVLTQKTSPRLALIYPEIDDIARVLKVKLHRSLWKTPGVEVELRIPLQVNHVSNEEGPSLEHGRLAPQAREVRYGEANIQVQAYNSKDVVDFFSAAIGTCCTIANILPANVEESHGLNANAEVNEVISVGGLPTNSVLHEQHRVSPTPLDPTFHEFIQKCIEGYSTKPLRSPQEGLAESMGANIVLADCPKANSLQLNDNCLFLNLGRRYTEIGPDNRPLTYHICRVANETLPKENLCTLHPKGTSGLIRVLWQSDKRASKPSVLKIGVGQLVTYESDTRC